MEVAAQVHIDTAHRIVHCFSAADSFQKVMYDGPLIVVGYDPFCFSEDVTCKPGRQQEVDNRVVEAQHGVMKLHDDQVFIVARIANDSRVRSRHAGDIEVRLDTHTTLFAIVASSTAATVGTTV